MFKEYGLIKGIFLLAFLALGMCLYFSANWRSEPLQAYATDNDCKKVLVENKVDLTPSTNDDGGELRLLGAYPPKAALGDTICIAVAGVAPKSLRDDLNTKRTTAAIELAKAKVAFEQSDRKEAARTALSVKQKAFDATLAGVDAPDATVLVFLGGDPIPGVKLTARSVPDVQFLHFDLNVDPDSTSDGGKFSRKLLSGTFWEQPMGEKTVPLGIARLSTDTPTETSSLVFVVFVRNALIFGGIALVLFLVACWLLAHTTNLLREAVLTEVPSKAAIKLAAARTKLTELGAAVDASGVAPANTPWLGDVTTKAKEADALLQEASGLMNETAVVTPPYSLAKVQIGIWAFLVVAGFVYVWLAMGQHRNLLTGGILALLGIQAVSTATSLQINSVYGADAFKSAQTTGRGFWSDILADLAGLNLGRLQAFAWTLLLAGIFVWDTVWNFTFPNFDTNLLLLLGITQGAYIGMKYAAIPKQG